ncbi:MAG TPA: hypothetical protein VE712_00370 [Actinomycetota bacterium]|nr:hypothetical protein [Actinomycetota bacterium]
MEGRSRGYLFVGIDVDDYFAEDKSGIGGRRLRQRTPTSLR